MESVKISSGLSGHGPQMLYQGSRQPPAHPNAGPIIRAPTTRSYESSSYKQTISPPPHVSRSGYPSYGTLEAPHPSVSARYLQQPGGYMAYPSREPHYVRPINDRPQLLVPPTTPRRPSIMGNYVGYNTKDLVQQIMTTSAMNPGSDSFKRMKLGHTVRTDVMYPPLVVETSDNHVSRESSYYPQVEAISPTLPPDPRDESPLHSTQDDLTKQIEQVDKDIMLIESSIANLRKKEETLRLAAQKGDSQSSQETEDVKEPRHQSTAQVIYAENRTKAEESHLQVGKNLIPPEAQDRVLPRYNQPGDCEVYQLNKKQFVEFKPYLIKHFRRIHELKTAREHKLIQNYKKQTTAWIRKVEKIENSKKHKEKCGKNRELFEKIFPELRKQREEKERFTRVGARVKSDAEMEEIMDGLQEQENEDKKMRAYAVIPPIMLGERQRRYQFINTNGLLKNPIEDYKESKNVNIWTEHECEMFKEKYLQHPKNFVVIASYLEKKSVSDCIQHYYLTKKKENYKLLVKRRMRRPRTKATAQTHMEALHLNARVRTRGSAQKELLKTEVVTSSSAVSGSSTEPCLTTTTTSSNTDQVSSNGPIEDWPEPVPLEVGAAQQSSPHKSSPTMTNSTNASNDLGELDKENLSNSTMLQQKENKSKDGDSSEEEQDSGPLSDCVVCKSRDYTNSRPIKPGTASQYGLKEEDVHSNARVCANCRCRAVRRTRQYVCQIPKCTTPKWKIKRLRPFPPRWNSLPSNIKDPIVKELEIPPDVNKSCQLCHNRIMRKLGSEAEEPLDASRWSESDIEALRQALRELGCRWSKVCDKVPGKSVGQIRSFYCSLKDKYELDEAVADYKKARGKSDPPSVTDEEESGSSTSSAEETGSSHPPLNPPSQVRHDSASDTLSACSPPPPMSSLEEKEATTNREPPPTHVPGTGREDYDSSATTVSADEGPSGIERDSPPEVEHIPHPGEKRTVPPGRVRSSQFNAQGQAIPEGAVFQDIISKTIVANLPDSDKSHPPSREITMETLLQPPQHFKENDIQRECLDLTVKKRDRSPPQRPNSQSGLHINSHSSRKDVPPMTIRGGAEVTLADKGSPPKAHSNSISYAYPLTDRYYHNDYRKSPVYLDRPPQTSSNMVTREPSPLGYPNRTQNKPVKSNMAPPPPVAVSSPGMAQICNLAQNSSRRPPVKQDKPPIPGSITLGTPVSPATHPSASLSHAPRYDLMAKPLPNREGGSITQGTPVHPDSKRQGIPQGIHLKDSQMLEQAGVEIVQRQSHDMNDAYRSQRGPSSMAGTQGSNYAYPSYSSYQRAPYSDSQISSREILKNDYLTSQQMPGRRGTPNEKEHPSRGREPSPQGSIKDGRMYSVPMDRRSEAMPNMMDPRGDRRSDQRKDVASLEYRAMDGRTVIQDRDKSRQYVRTSGFVPTYYQPVGMRSHPADYRGGSRTLSSPAAVRDATPTPPSSESSHDYRVAHAMPSHSRVNTVIQSANKLPVSSAMRSEPGRHSPHGNALQGGEFVVSPRRDGKQIEGLGSVMIGNRHMYDPRPSSRDKHMHQVIAEDKRYADRRERTYHKDDDNMDKHMLNKYTMDIKAVPSQKRSEQVDVKNLMDPIIRKMIGRSAEDSMNRDARSYRREDPPTSHGYPMVSENDKRVRSPAYKEKDIVTVKDASEINHGQRVQVHKDSHSSSMHPSLSYGNIIKSQQLESLMNREGIGLDLKKIGNHHPYNRPSLEITRTDARPSLMSQSDQSKMSSQSPMMYPIDMESKDRYDSKSPHRMPTSTSNAIHRDHLAKDERQIIRIAHNTQSQSHPEEIDPFDLMKNKIQQLFRWEDNSDKDCRTLESQRMSRSATPSQRQIRVPHPSPSSHHINMTSLGQNIRTGSHYDDDSSHPKKRARLEAPQGSPGQRPPSRPVSNSGGGEAKEYHREEDVDSPQSGEMVIDENPNRDAQKMSGDPSAGRSAPPTSQMEDKERAKCNSYPNMYRGYPVHTSGASMPPHTSSWGVSAPSKNGGFQGYEPNVEPVSDDE